MTIYKITDTNADTSVYCEFEDAAFDIAAVMAYTKYRSSSLESLVETFSENREYKSIKIEEIYVI